MTEFRWIFAALGVCLLAGIWGWGKRRAARSAVRAELREAPTLTAEAEPRAYYAPAPVPAPGEDTAPAKYSPEARERIIPHLEPLDIRTATAAEEALFDEPMSALCDPIDVTIDLAHVATDIGEPHPLTAPPAPPAAAPVPTRDLSAAHVPSPAPNTSELQRIVTLRVCAAGEARWAGERLMSALELNGLAFGRYDVYHRKHVDGRSLFCVASLVEPGTFDVSRMAQEEFRGVTLFAVLPGPLDPVHTLDALFETAGVLAEELAGVVQDHKGVVMTASRAVALREEMVEFRALLAS